METKPQTIAESLIDTLNNLSFDQRHSSFVLRRFKKDADVLRGKDQGAGFNVLGVIATFERKLDEVCYNFDLSLRYRETSFTHDNYAISLAKLGYYNEAWDAISKAIDVYKDDLSLLDCAIKTSFVSGRIFQSFDLIVNRWDKLSPGKQYRFSPIIHAVQKKAKKLNLLEKDICAFFNTFTEPVRNNSLFIFSEEFSFQDNHGPSISYLLDDINIDLHSLFEETDSNLKKFSSDLNSLIRYNYECSDEDELELINSIEADIDANPSNIVEVDHKLLHRIANLINVEGVQWQK